MQGENMTFQEHAQDFFALQELVNEAFYNEDGTPKEVDDSVRASVAAIVDQWGKDFKHKAERVAQFIIELDNQAEAWKVEAKRFAERAKKNENTITSVKFLVQRTMEQLKLTKLEAGVFTISIANNPPAMIVQNQDVIPLEYFDEVPATLKLDSAKLKKDLVDGKEVEWRKPVAKEEGAELYTGPGAIISRGTSLRIK
jgi:predicted SpoU family rRNA methylase